MEILKKGQTVTRKSGGNATDFNGGKLDFMGAFADKYNEETVFEIEGTVKLITFDHCKETCCAYLLKKDGVNVGYVYNDHLSKVETSRVVSNKELLIKYTNLLNDVKQSIELYGDGGFGRPSGLYNRAKVLEMIINDLEVK